MSPPHTAPLPSSCEGDPMSFRSGVLQGHVCVEDSYGGRVYPQGSSFVAVWSLGASVSLLVSEDDKAGLHNSSNS